jgi:heme/copper-type cytochrome/quinol oxidase subunit 2
MNNEQFNQLMEEQKSQTEALKNIGVSISWILAIIIIVLIVFVLIMWPRIVDVIMYG